MRGERGSAASRASRNAITARAGIPAAMAASASASAAAPPTAMSRSSPAAAAARPDSRWSDVGVRDRARASRRARRPCARTRAPPRTVSSACCSADGLELYESSMSVIPPGSRSSSPRCVAGCSRAAVSTISDTGISNWIATAVAASTFDRLPQPEQRRRQRGGACRCLQLAPRFRRARGARRALARTSASVSMPKVTT